SALRPRSRPSRKTPQCRRRNAASPPACSAGKLVPPASAATGFAFLTFTFLLSPFTFPGMEFSRDELFDAIDRLVSGLLERAGVIGPPVNALAIAEEHLGIPVAVVEPAEEDERGRRRPRARPASAGIVLSSDMTDEQRQKAAADGIARTLQPDIL